jgi:hypothetical protein
MVITLDTNFDDQIQITPNELTLTPDATIGGIQHITRNCGKGAAYVMIFFQWNCGHFPGNLAQH